jgi:redox-sensing transcriptional repressor
MRHVSQSTVRRLSLYLRTLEEFRNRGDLTVSSRDLAERVGLTPAQVRKDLSYFGSFGKRGLGYEVPDLQERLRGILGVDRTWGVGVVGAGRVGLALARYPSFGPRGFHMKAIFDNDPAKIGERSGELTIRDIATFPEAADDLGIEIVILTVPEDAAQEVADRVVAAGVRAILNFAPVGLQVPAGVVVNDVDMVLELEGLSFALTNGSSGGI